MSDSLSPQTKIRSLEETVRLETRAKTLNPKWYEGMLKHGFRGVAEIENHVANTFGWSATADAVEPWIYTEDFQNVRTWIRSCLSRLLELNPHSVAFAHEVVCFEAHDSRILESGRDGVLSRGYADIVGQPNNPVKASNVCTFTSSILYVGSSLLAPLKQAEREINRQYDLDLTIAAYNFGAPHE